MTSAPSGPDRLRPLPGFAGRNLPGESPLPDELTADDRRARILAATAELIAEHGYHGATLEQIVRRARVGWSAFYKHFADKEAAFLTLLDESYEAGLALLHTAAARTPEPWPRSVASALAAIFTALAERPDLAHACLVEVLTAGPAAVKRYERALQDTRPLLLPGRALNPRAAELSESLEETLAGGVAWIAYQRLVEGEAERIPALLPEALAFVLLPYLGEAETAHAIQQHATV